MPSPAAEPVLPKLRKAKLVQAVAEYAIAQATIERCKPIILDEMGDHSLAQVGNHRVKVSHTEAVPAVPAVTITEKMVGQVIPAKKARGASTRLTVS